ncbi:BadM/Rrf2 family transcriptional regulator [Pontibacter ummariensis]|uniref:Transcriptional regulator, BadM/Rrf2 family n=1 Tax=Pontibacter ummariensis TaxID=1610492 RepID=A0A239LTW1_9BACT|nr:Rrf2 family transcriptional regulator [Pontibacter ummariensis]PRY01221.1 BadM/Rrf2 family transcriptional regulator [Pontibacter ummariensis]SNT33233.1 transcriptional regulator, BadM/Rrf2 family [Pontibacter ummariensis]
MLSKTTEYALRAIVYIAINSVDGHKVGIKEIAQELELPAHFLGKILQDLVRKGVISSIKGPHGGFFLHRPASKINILEVVRIIDGLEAFKKCGMGMKECSDKHPCPLHNDIKTYRDHLLKVFSTKTIQDLVDGIRTGKYFITNVPEEA